MVQGGCSGGSSGKCVGGINGWWWQIWRWCYGVVVAEMVVVVLCVGGSRCGVGGKCGGVVK